MFNTCLRSGDGGVLSRVLVTSFVPANVSKLVVSKGFVGGTLVFLAGEETVVAALGQEDVMCDGKRQWNCGEEDLVPRLIIEFYTM